MSMAGDKFNRQEENGDNHMVFGKDISTGKDLTCRTKGYIKDGIINIIEVEEVKEEVKNMKQILEKGWVPFANLIKKYKVKTDGNEYRKLKKIENKVNISTSDKSYWIVEEEEFKKVFEVE